MNVNKESHSAVRFSFLSFLIATVHFLRLDIIFISCISGHIKLVMLNKFESYKPYKAGSPHGFDLH